MRSRPRSHRPALAPALALAVALAACGGSDLFVGVEEGGNVRFVLSADAPSADLLSDMPTLRGGETDALTTLGEGGEDERPRDYRFFESANVTFSSVLARNFDGVLDNVEMELPVTVDIMAIEGGREVTLPEGTLPAATYDQIVVVMTAFQGVTHGGTTITIEPPGGGWTAVIPICPFEVVDGETTTVSLSFMLRHAFKWREGRFFFEPRFRCETDDDDEPEEPEGS